MGGRHTGGAKGTRAYRTDCPRCGRDTAVSWNQRTGEPYLRNHNDPMTREKCPHSGKGVRREYTR